MVALERKKIRGAIRTDFILSAEIIVIALGTVSKAPFGEQLLVLSVIAAIMTVFVYGLVACIIKLDDLGLFLSVIPGERPRHRLGRASGRGILRMAPWLMRTLSIAGTIAMFTVGGGILTHGIGPLHHTIEEISHGSGLREFLVPLLLNLITGVIAGAVLVGGLLLVKKFMQRDAEQVAA